MVAKGLLVEDQKGQEYLLSTEPLGNNGAHHICLSRRLEGKWVLLDVGRSKSIRACLIAALLDFFGGICRILDHVDMERKQS
jgi:hypothetical protein